jgi:exodeoxyribonuclease V gamma subunit
MHAFAAAIESVAGDPHAGATLVECAWSHNGFTLQGRVRLLPDGRLLQFRPAGVKAKDKLALWCAHLLVNASGEQPCESLLAGGGDRDSLEALRYRIPQQAGTLLGEIVRLYERAHGEPLAFYPATSLAYAAALARGADERYALAQAADAWYGNAYSDGECNDPFYRYVPADANPLDKQFRALATAVFGPLLAHEEAAAL